MSKAYNISILLLKDIGRLQKEHIHRLHLMLVKYHHCPDDQDTFDDMREAIRDSFFNGNEEIHFEDEETQAFWENMTLENIKEE